MSRGYSLQEEDMQAMNQAMGLGQQAAMGNMLAKGPAVSQSLQSLNKRVEMLNEVVTALEHTLGPILLPQPPNTRDDSKMPREGSSPVIEQLDLAVAMLGQLAARLTDIQRRAAL